MTEVNDTKPSYYDRVHALFVDSLYQGEPDISKAKIVEGVVRNAGFDPARLEANKPKIIELAKEMLDDAFLKDKGGGMSFMCLPFTKNEEQWGEQYDAELLYFLCAGVGCASFCMPRPYWSVMPGGMPYIVFDLSA